MMTHASQELFTKVIDTLPHLPKLNLPLGCSDYIGI